MLRLFTKLLIGVWLLSSSAFAAFAANTKAYYIYAGNGNDATGTYNQTASGTPVFTTAGGFQGFGPASDANYYNTPVGLGTVLAAQTWNVFEGYFWLVSAASPAAFQTLATTSATNIFRLSATNVALRWDTATGIEGGSVTTGVWMNFAFVGTGTTRRIYLNNVSVANDGTNGLFPTNTAIMIGSLHAVGFDGYYFNGYFRNLRFSAGAGSPPTSFPTVDPNNTLRSPYLKNVVRPYLGRPR